MSNISCSSWMQSQQGLSPCATAEMVGQACVADYAVLTTNFQESQYIPNTTTANPCTCSWASYNLLSACASCLGQEQLASWSTWAASCGSYVSSSTYFPYDSGYRLPTGKTIPYFSGTNPQTWTNGTFNPTQASTIGSGADLTGAPVSSATPSTSSSSNTSVGAIAGGVIGGVAVLLILVGFIFFVLYLRRRRLSAFSSGHLEPLTPSYHFSPALHKS
ncbi:hypothetical protein F5I97DRAFT_1650331 [Phlebopus sp. FC_14]|nr:hypothetical protein F5I97DRAFT_1650331 [Phlebopus sp. FC_14]